MGENSSRRRLRLRGGHRQPHTCCLQVGQQPGYAVEKPVHRPAAGAVVRPVGRDGCVCGLAQSHLAQRVMHRRADDAAGQITVGYRGADLAECMPEAGHDALRRIGQSAVEIEDHQLRARRDGTAHGFCHDSIVTDVYCRAVASQPRDSAPPSLADVIDVLEAAYPPLLAQDWDSVGLVCGDPQETVETVTVAVDATAAVVAEVPDHGLLLAHHPLLLRGVDTVAASTAKGALVHQMIRTGRALFTAHTNADAASPGVSDALADALGLAVEEVLAPISVGTDLDKWVVFVPADNADGVREAMFTAGAGHIGDYSHCSWSVSGTGQFLPHEGASPAIGRVGTVERVPEERVELIAPARLRAHVLAAMRTAHPYEEPAFDIFALAPVPGDVGLGRVGVLPRPEPLSAFVSRVHDALPGTSWGVRASGDSEAPVSRVAVCGGAGDSLLDTVADAGVQAYVTADLRHHPADEHRRTSDVALVDVAHWASEFPWCTQAADLLRSHFGDALPVRVSAVRTDPWNVERNGS
jgi:dinuclear metal center YbgI/SA1388 family protein